LEESLNEQVSDIHLVTGQPVFFRIDGQLRACRDFYPEKEELESIISEIINERQQDILLQKRELDFSWEYKGRRFRTNAYYQRGHLALAMRLLPANIPSLDSLGCPVKLKDFIHAENGLLLVTGKTGAGKTTTLAALVDFFNHSRTAHIITLEDPVEYIHKSSSCLVSQRELGTDFYSFSSALRSALREDPDLIMVGELRDRDTMMTALNAAETGHFVMGSLHTQSAAEAVMRIESMFPAEQQSQIRAQLSIVLAGVFSQKLLPAAGGGRVCAAEILLATPAVRNIIRTGKFQQLDSVILSGMSLGMQTMELSVERLYQEHRITKNIAEIYLT